MNHDWKWKLKVVLLTWATLGLVVGAGGGLLGGVLTPSDPGRQIAWRGHAYDLCGGDSTRLVGQLVEVKGHVGSVNTEGRLVILQGHSGNLLHVFCYFPNLDKGATLP